MDAKQIIMNYTTPPGLNDFETLAVSALDALPDELIQCSENLRIAVEDFPDDATMTDMGVEDVYELLAVYKSAKELTPGVEKKQNSGDDSLFIYRRPILDLWCENCDDLSLLLREVMIEEIARAHDFSDDDIEDMTSRHHQQMF